MMTLLLIYLFKLPLLAATLQVPLVFANLYMIALATVGLTLLGGWRNVP